MPIFEFRCPACETVFEKLVLSRAQEVRCATCGGPVHKLMSAAVTRTKGADGRTTSTSSSCSTCNAPTCTGCH